VSLLPVSILAAILTGISAATSMSLLLLMLFGPLTMAISAFSLCAGTAAGFFVYVTCRGYGYERPRLTFFDFLMIFFFVLFCFRQFLWIYFHKNGAIYTQHPQSLGDLPAHIQFIRYFARGATFWPENPIFVGEKFYYTFGMDLFSALFVNLGIPIEIVLPITGFTLGLTTLLALLHWGRGFTVGGLLFAGGVAGFSWMVTGTLNDYHAGVPLPWNAVMVLMIPQRALLFGLPCGLLLLWSWRRRFVMFNSVGLPAWLEGCLWGFFPLFHIHTFLFLSILFAIWVTATRRFKEGWSVLRWALIPATLEVVMLTNFFEKKSLFWFKWGWIIDDQNPFLFFMTHFGFFVFLALFAIYHVMAPEKKEHRLLVYPGLAFFGACFYVVVTPWIFDNVKIMIWGYLLLLPVMGEALEERVRWPWRVGAYFLLFFSGFLTLFSEHVPTYPGIGIATDKEIDGVCHATKDLPVSSRFATVQTYNHPVAMCGQPLVAGFGGHLSGYKIDAAAVQENLHRLMRGDPEWRALSVSLQARYLFWGIREQGEYPKSTRPWENAAVRIAEGEWGAIYDLGLPP